MEEKVVIVGAGPAGLTAAYQLIKNSNYKPVIIEKEDFIGGISRTYNYKGNSIDIGGHRFFSKSKIVNDIWQELLPLQGYPAKDDLLLNTKKDFIKNGANPEKEDLVLLIRNRVSRIFTFGHFIKYPISLSVELLSSIGFIQSIKAGLAYVFSLFHKLPETSLENFYINRFGTTLYKLFFESYTQKVWGIHPSELSSEWGAQRVKGLSIKTIILEEFKKFSNKNFKTNQTSLIESFYYPKFGPGQLWEEMARQIILNGGEIKFNSEIDKIEVQGEKINKIYIRSKDQVEEIPVKAIFSSMPINELCKLLPTPSEINKIAQELQYRSFITIGLLLKKLKIKNETSSKTINNIPPDNWIYIQDKNVKIGRLQIYNNWSPYLVSDFENTVWLGLEYFCSENDHLWNLNENDFINMALDELEKINIIDNKDFLDYKLLKVPKAYPIYHGSYKNFGEIKNYLNSIENLYCIGRNGQHRYNNMDHSMLTSIEAVKLFLEGNLSKETLWNINTEEEYHEIKRDGE